MTFRQISNYMYSWATIIIQTGTTPIVCTFYFKLKIVRHLKKNIGYLKSILFHGFKYKYRNTFIPAKHIGIFYRGQQNTQIHQNPL